jgi:hypothetical protein
MTKTYIFPKLNSLKISKEMWDAANFNRVIFCNAQLEMFIAAWTSETGEARLAELREVFDQLLKLKHLDLSHYTFSGESVKMIGEIVPYLTSLHLERTPDLDKIFEKFLLLFQNPQFLPNLETLEIIIEDYEMLEDFLNQNVLSLIDLRMKIGSLRSRHLLPTELRLNMSKKCLDDLSIFWIDSDSTSLASY